MTDGYDWRSAHGRPRWPPTCRACRWFPIAGIEGVGAAQPAYDPTFVTPSGHTGVTFLAVRSGGRRRCPAATRLPRPMWWRSAARRLTLTTTAMAAKPAGVSRRRRTLNNGSSRTRRPAAGRRPSGGFSGTYGIAAGGSSARRPGRRPFLRRPTRAGWAASRCPRPGRPPPATRPTRLTRSTTARRRPGPCWGRWSSIRPRRRSGPRTAGSSSRSWATSYPTSGTLTVVLNASSANGTVVADAIGIAPAWASGGGRSLVRDGAVVPAPLPEYRLPHDARRGLRRQRE